MTATAMLTPENRWPSGVAAPDQALVAPETRGNFVNRVAASKPVFGGATGFGAGGRGAGLLGNRGTDGMTCTAASGDTYRTLAFSARARTPVCGTVATNAGVNWKFSLTCMPGTVAAIVLDCTSARVFWTMTRTMLVGSAWAPYCRRGWIFCVATSVISRPVVALPALAADAGGPLTTHADRRASTKRLGR